MKITEVFSGLQGEGKLIGFPTTFIRFAKCNLACPFCDTKYSWTEGKEYTEEQIVKKAKEYKNDYVCFTGGEPTIDLDSLKSLAKTLADMGYHTSIETNGSNYLGDLTEDIHFIVCSPKYLNGEWRYDRENDNAVDEFKFVVENEEDVKIILQDFEPYKISLMPKASSREEYLKVAPIIWELCEKYKLHFSPREHIVLFDKKRGV